MVSYLLTSTRAWKIGIGTELNTLCHCVSSDDMCERTRECYMVLGHTPRYHDTAAKCHFTISSSVHDVAYGEMTGQIPSVWGSVTSN